MTRSFSLRYSDDNKNNTFNNSGNNEHGLKNVACKQTFKITPSLPVKTLLSFSIVWNIRLRCNNYFLFVFATINFLSSCVNLLSDIKMSAMIMASVTQSSQNLQTLVMNFPFFLQQLDMIMLLLLLRRHSLL